MAQTLFEILSSINDANPSLAEAKPDDDGKFRINGAEVVIGQDGTVALNKRKTLLDVINSWKSSNEVVRDVIAGNTTFRKEYLKSYGSVQLETFTQPYTPPEQTPRVKALRECIDSFPTALHGYHAANMYPAAAFVGGGAMAVTGAILDGVSRRSFIKFIGGAGIIVGGFTAVGSAIYGLDPGFKQGGLLEMKNNSEYLDQLFKELYGNNQHSTRGLARRELLGYFTPGRLTPGRH